ncbi:hypothetical protein NKH77_54515 [Streptomyces sp. M19]
MSTSISTTHSDASAGAGNPEPAVGYAAVRGPASRPRPPSPSPALARRRRAAREPTARRLPLPDGGQPELRRGGADRSRGPDHLRAARGGPARLPQLLLLRRRSAQPGLVRGAYTVQTNIVGNGQGRVWGAPPVGWDNSATVGEAGESVLVDGAKRDRTIWPGDLGVSVLTDYVSLGDLRSVRNSLQTLYHHQSAEGAFPTRARR